VPNNAEPMTHEPWVRVVPVAQRLGAACDAVCRWIDGRDLPAYKLGRLWKFKLSDVHEPIRAGGSDADDALEATK
jgi:excisionase family DNA binding protein